MGKEGRRREPLSESHRALGAALRAARERLRKTTREVPGYTSGHISNVENGYVTPSELVVAAYAQLGADPAPLRGLLEAARAESARLKLQRLKPASVDESDPDVTVDSPLEEIRARYDFDDLEYLVRYDSAGVLNEIVAVLTARATQLPVTLVMFSALYNADPRPGVVGLEALSGCQIVQVRPSAAGAMAAVASLDEPIDGHMTTRAKYSYRIRVYSSIRAQPLLREYSIKFRARQAFRIQFTHPAVPTSIWWFRATDIVDTMGEPLDEHLLPVHPSGFVRFEFEGVAREIIGLAWQWPDD